LPLYWHCFSCLFIFHVYRHGLLIKPTLAQYQVRVLVKSSVILNDYLHSCYLCLVKNMDSGTDNVASNYLPAVFVNSGCFQSVCFFRVTGSLQVKGHPATGHFNSVVLRGGFFLNTFFNKPIFTSLILGLLQKIG